MGQINTNNYPTVDSLADTDLLIVENATHGTGTTTPKQLRENAIGTDPLQTTAQTVTGAINELKNSGGLPENPLSTAHGGTGNSAGYIQTGRSTQSALGTGATIEGHNNTGAGTYCHAEGHDNSCGANASYSHVEGQSNNVSGIASHAEGYGCSVSGNYSHAGGYYNTVGHQNQAAVGKYNNNKSGTLFEVGNGTGTSARSNAFEVYSDGKTSWDNGSSKFQFTQSSGVDGYYDASGTFHAFGGSGNTISKTWYPIIASLWSGAQNADGYYTYSFSLNPQLNNSVNVYIAESSSNTYPTDTERAQFALVDRVRVLGAGAITLYAKTKPTSNFYVWVEGVNGSGNASIEGNVIQPNGESSGGGGIPTIDEMTSVSPYNTSRCSVKAGGYKQIGNKVYVNIILVLKFNMTTQSDLTARLWDSWDCYIHLPKPKYNAGVMLNLSWMYKSLESGAENRYYRTSTGPSWVYTNGTLNDADLSFGSIKDLDGTDSTKEIIAIITGEYDV